LPRPKKFRYVKYIPNITEFIPIGETNEGIIILNVEELEAVRLIDLENLEQEESAKNMGISRGTLQRILNSSRSKIAESLINGKKLIIEGGDYQINECLYTCRKCNSNYNNENLADCPKCHSSEYQCNGQKIFCRDVCKGYRGGR